MSTNQISNKPLVSIIIPNYNGEDVIKECLLSVTSDAKHLNCEVLVVDNGSTDKSINMVQRALVRRIVCVLRFSDQV